MRVLVVHNRYRSGLPSGEDRVVDQEMSLLRCAGHHITSFERHSDDIARMSFPRKALLPLQVPWNGAVRTELAAQLRVDRPDIVHIHNTFPLLSPSVLAACSDAGVPVVVTLHNYQLVCPAGTLMRQGDVCTDCTGRLPMPALRHGCYRDSRLATLPMVANMMLNRHRWQSEVVRFFCVSEAHRRVLIETGVPPGRLAVKHHFVHDPGVRRSGAGSYVLFPGRLTEDKGVRLLMAAWEQLDVGMPLVLAGDGPLRDEVQKWADRRDDVRYLGLRSHAECRDLMAQAATIVAPSKAMETFGLVLVEAMAAAVPVVAAGHGGFTDLVQNNVTGVLHRPNDVGSLTDSLRRVLTDARENVALGEAARSAYEARFTPEAGLAALVAGYEAAIAVFSAGRDVSA